MKTKLTVDEQIDHMKQKGIKFDIVSEEYAQNLIYLITHTISNLNHMPKHLNTIK